MSDAPPPSRPWMRHAVPAAMALACGVYLATSDAPASAKVVAVLVFVAAVVVWTNARDLRIHVMVHRYSALGQPRAILALVAPELAYHRAARMRVPLAIYQALALSLLGEWAQALAVLDAVDIRSVRGKAGRTWHYLYCSHRLNCLLFTGRTAEARDILQDHIEPFAATVRSPGTQLIRDEARAKLAYFEDRRGEARDAFEALAARSEIVPASRAFYSYFLGRLALDRGEPPEEHFARAVELAPETFLPDAIAELARE